MRVRVQSSTSLSVRLPDNKEFRINLDDPGG
jgi:hypothetical protein